MNLKTDPYKIALINMPFASLSMPSLALTQLAEVLDQQFGDQVEVGVHYLSFDFVDYMGDLAFYNHAHLGEGFMTGIGEWFFRQAAFPDAEDNAEEYFNRFYHTKDMPTGAIREAFAEKRKTLDAFLDSRSTSTVWISVISSGLPPCFPKPLHPLRWRNA